MYLERHIKNVWSFDFPPTHFTFQQAQQNQPPTLAFHQARCVHMGKWKCRTNPSQASTMVSYKKTQKRKQTHHGKWVTKNSKAEKEHGGWSIRWWEEGITWGLMWEGGEDTLKGFSSSNSLFRIICLCFCSFDSPQNVGNLKIAIAGTYKLALHLCSLPR